MGGRDWDDHGLKLVQAKKKLTRLHLNQYLDMVPCTYHQGKIGNYKIRGSWSRLAQA
jgi:hypothetical protein